jgi:hypothetical protein
VFFKISSGITLRRRRHISITSRHRRLIAHEGLRRVLERRRAFPGGRQKSVEPSI